MITWQATILLFNKADAFRYWWNNNIRLDAATLSKYRLIKRKTAIFYGIYRRLLAAS